MGRFPLETKTGNNSTLKKFWKLSGCWHKQNLFKSEAVSTYFSKIQISKIWNRDLDVSLDKDNRRISHIFWLSSEQQINCYNFTKVVLHLSVSCLLIHRRQRQLFSIPSKIYVQNVSAFIRQNISHLQGVFGTLIFLNCVISWFRKI